MKTAIAILMAVLLILPFTEARAQPPPPIPAFPYIYSLIRAGVEVRWNTNDPALENTDGWVWGVLPDGLWHFAAHVVWCGWIGDPPVTARWCSQPGRFPLKEVGWYTLYAGVVAGEEIPPWMLPVRRYILPAQLYLPVIY